ncbi:MAG: hypothetical protein HY548_07245 [Elusimicrobia bacterium]|nr:hypothetical protein [Elusimicrobiota bacterium]
MEDEAHKRSSSVLDSLRDLRPHLFHPPVDAVLAISPFWIPEKSFCVDAGAHHASTVDYRGYAVEVKYSCPGDPGLAHALVAEGHRAGLPALSRHHGADLSAAVPMHFLSPRGQVPLVPLSSTERSREECVEWGRCLRRAVEASGKRVLLFCGGGLSHNLTACLHWEDSIAAVIFDQKVLECLKKGRGMDVAKIDPFWIEMGNPPARLRDLYMFLGACGVDSKGKLMAYDGAPGEGWAVMRFS